MNFYSNRWAKAGITAFLPVTLALVLADAALQAETLLSNLEAKEEVSQGSPLDPGRGKAVDFTLAGDRAFQVCEVALRLELTPASRPSLVLMEKERSYLVPLNQAAGLGVGAKSHSFTLKDGETAVASGTADVIFNPVRPVLLLPGGSYRLALSNEAKEGRIEWLGGSLPAGPAAAALHAGQVTGKGAPGSWASASSVVNLYAIRGAWQEGLLASSGGQASPPAGPYRQFSGIFPHLAMFSTERPTECGIGAVVNWADRLWAVTYAPFHHRGSADKLFEIDADHHIRVFSGSVGGTPACRMIHEESGHLLIGPYLVDRERQIRVIPPAVMPGRLTGLARHLTDPVNKVYYATMEEGLYEVDVRSLSVQTLFKDAVAFRGQSNEMTQLPGYHGKGLYSGQGRLVYSNNGGWSFFGVRKVNRDFSDHGSLSEWDGNRWSVLEKTGFLDVTGPGGIRGNRHPQTDPLWAFGWDFRSVILKVLDGGVWHTYRLPKASHAYDGPHGILTEWPRIGEIGSATERLLYTHGLFWRFPTSFSAASAGGIRPRSSVLKMVSDSTPWQGRIAFACNDLSNETQAIKINPRKTRGNLTPSISHSNLWFVEPEQLDALGVPIGRGAVWINDPVQASTPSVPYQCGGWEKRAAHLSHGSAEEVTFTFEFDERGDGLWRVWKSMAVAAGQYRFVSLADAPPAEWLRLRVDRDLPAATAVFAFARPDHRSPTAAAEFSGLAQPSAETVSGGLVRIKATDGCPLGLVAQRASKGRLEELGYYEMNADMTLRKVDDPAAAAALSEVARIPTGVISVDAASALYIDDEDGKRYRLPRGDVSFDREGPLGPERIDREVVRERNLFNWHGTFYELPYRVAGGFPLIRPISTHNRRIKDYCTWRGLLVITGMDEARQGTNPQVIRSEDGLVSLWVGAVDDLWKLGKAVGVGGPWKDSAVQAGVPSDPYLMTGYDRKTLSLAHASAQPLRMEVQVDITGSGDWQSYCSFEVPAGETLTHLFPDDFNAYWLRVVAAADTVATAQLLYE